MLQAVVKNNNLNIVELNTVLNIFNTDLILLTYYLSHEYHTIVVVDDWLKLQTQNHYSSNLVQFTICF